jgi:hypothetical protein
LNKAGELALRLQHARSVIEYLINRVALTGLANGGLLKLRVEQHICASPYWG